MTLEHQLERCLHEQKSEYERYNGVYTNYPRARAYWQLGLSDWVMEELLVQEEIAERDRTTPIATKQQFYEGQKRSVFGNHLRRQEVWCRKNDV